MYFYIMYTNIYNTYKFIYIYTYTYIRYIRYMYIYIIYIYNVLCVIIFLCLFHSMIQLL